MKWLRLLLILGLFVTFAFGFRTCWRSPMTAQPAPELYASHWFNSEPLSMQSLAGKLVLLDFWALW